jgi:hypothetical protein
MQIRAAWLRTSAAKRPPRQMAVDLIRASASARPSARPSVLEPADPLVGPNRITNPRIKVGCSAAPGALPAQTPHANAQKAHIAQGYGRRSSHESSHGIPGRAFLLTGVPHGRRSVPPPRQRGPRLLRAQSGRREDPDGSYAMPQAQIPGIDCHQMIRDHRAQSAGWLVRPGRSWVTVLPVCSVLSVRPDGGTRCCPRRLGGGDG